MLEDVLTKNLQVVFCGTAVGKVSAIRQAYYAGPGNQFYPVLFKVGFTPVLFSPSQFRELVKHKMGLTDLVKSKAGNDSEMEKSHFDVKSFQTKIEKFTPQFVAFNGKRAAAEFLGYGKKTKMVNYGAQNFSIGKSKVFVLPSTSGSARGSWDISVWENFYRAIR